MSNSFVICYARQSSTFLRAYICERPMRSRRLVSMYFTDEFVTLLLSKQDNCHVVMIVIRREIISLCSVAYLCGSNNGSNIIFHKRHLPSVHLNITWASYIHFCFQRFDSYWSKCWCKEKKANIHFNEVFRDSNLKRKNVIL